MPLYIPRDVTPQLIKLAEQYPFVTVTGPRQSGKSTLLRHTFPDYKYVSLEDIDYRNLAAEDPRGFIANFPDKTIIDEVQRVPSILSYLQTYTDIKEAKGMYLLAGSQNLLLMEQISQTLAGRTAIIKLLPLSIRELKESGQLSPNPAECIFTGGYPRIFSSHLNPEIFYPFYIQTYVERDVRSLGNIEKLDLFLKFIRLCAGRIGQLLNISSLAAETGISMPTVQNWLSILKASYICFLLPPYYENFSKRIIKTPKLYFYDTGLACSLLGIRSAADLSIHYAKGALFENMMITEMMKRYYNSVTQADLYFWRDSAGLEVDLLTVAANGPEAYEIKSGATFNTSFFDNLKKWQKLSGVSAERCKVIYGGDTDITTVSGRLISWKNLDEVPS